MNLTKVGFNYEIKKKAFSNIYYEFSVVNPEMKSVELIDTAKKQFGELEQMLDMHYTGRKFKKEEDGVINSYSIEYGYNYSNNISIKSIFKTDLRTSSKIKLEIITHQGKYPAGFKVNISNHDANSKRLFTIYDNILMLQGLNISEDAQAQINVINFLREQKFNVNDLNKYLERT